MVHVGKNAASAEFGPQKRCRSQARRQRPHPDSLKRSLPQENRGQFRFSMSFVIPIICRKHSKGLWLLENCHVFLCRGDGDVLELTVPCANLWCVHIRVLKSKMDYKHNSFGKLKLLQQEISINIRLRTIISYSAKSKDMSKTVLSIYHTSRSSPPQKCNCRHLCQLLLPMQIWYNLVDSSVSKFRQLVATRSKNDPKCINMPSSVDEVPKHALGKVHFELLSFDGGYCLDGLSIR